MPLTKGHCHLIDTALRYVDRLTILVCTLQREPIDGHLRYRWVRETYPEGAYPQCNIIHVTDEVPSYPHEHPDFWEIWRELILRYAPDLDVVFTSEKYGDMLAQTLGCRHICVDLSRSAVPISATQVRGNPLRNWEYMPAAVRPYYAHRVLILDRESSGEQSLARQLANYFETAYMPDYARDSVAARTVEGDSAGLTQEDIARISADQVESEEEAAKRANKVVFYEANIIRTGIDVDQIPGHCPYLITRIAGERPYDLCLVTGAEKSMDGYTPPQLAHAQQLAERLRSELDSGGLDYFVTNRTGEARLQAAVEAVSHFLEAQEDIQNGRPSKIAGEEMNRYGK